MLSATKVCKILGDGNIQLNLSSDRITLCRYYQCFIQLTTAGNSTMKDTLMMKYGIKTSRVLLVACALLLLTACGDDEYVSQVEPMSGAPTIESQREAVAERKEAAEALKAKKKARLEKAAQATKEVVTESVAEVKQAAQAAKEVVSESVAEVKQAVE
jgi:hypothetical protein